MHAKSTMDAQLTTRSRERGIALVSVLWLVALLAVIASSFSVSTRTEVLLARNQIDSTQARYVAEAGIQLGILQLLDPNRQKAWPADGSAQEFTLGEVQVRIAIQDETGKIDLNMAPAELLVGLLQSVGVEAAERDRLADAILDWRDTDDLRSANGAEAKEYEAAGLPYGPKNATFDSVEELERVIGMTPAVYRKLQASVTVNSQRAAINPAAAPRSVLVAIPGMSAELADAYLALRREDYAQRLPAPPPPAAGGVYLAEGSGVAYSVRADALMPGGARAGIEAMVSLGEGSLGRPYSVLAWKEGVQGK